MPAVLVHGVPDTHRVWDGLRQNLVRTDVEAWDLPGFGAERPSGFKATKEAYVDWLIAKLEGVGEPVDLVGHDWGCILTARVASLRPDLVRTWAGGNGPISSRYVWHPLAKTWQSSTDGDRYMAELKAESFANDLIAGFDVPQDSAHDMVRHVDAVMKESILDLYRSAVTVGVEWEPDLSKSTAPSLIFWGALDPACQVEFAYSMGERMRAHVVRVDSNHWPILQRPAEVASELERFWKNAVQNSDNSRA
ncbi:alpha/beta hydrolase [Streptomyces sp. AK02-01A]|uniref:alpha/beta fold hydrolase n=1 Tax=Streptomyces sp. AK02-01A TaxID=3028648 RepID=UPI0029B4B81F|nr:alpha/beta hydrolase [Streptomyces sp. AK02-01A]MDX3852703.1 alpha/beta hydrolase [Streptomyces sp. AK02-01A]